MIHMEEAVVEVTNPGVVEINMEASQINGVVKIKASKLSKEVQEEEEVEYLLICITRLSLDG